MKNITLIFGYLAAVCLIIFPFCLMCGHFCGASWFVALASAFFSLGYAPLLFIQRQKFADASWKKVFNVLLLVTMLMAGVTLSAHHFHCPVALGLACVTYTLIILVIIFQIWKAVKAKEPKCSLNNHNIAINLIMILVLFSFMQASTMPRKAMDEFLCVYSTQQQEAGYFQGKALAFMENFDKNAVNNPSAQEYYAVAKQITDQSDSLVAFLNTLGKEMIFIAAKKDIPLDSLENLCHKADIKSVKKVMFEQKNDSILNEKLKAFTQLVSENTNSRGKEIIELFFPAIEKDSLAAGKACNPGSCSPECCNNCCCGPCSLMGQLVGFNSQILHIRMLQSETLIYLQAMQARVLNRAAVQEEKKEESNPDS